MIYEKIELFNIRSVESECGAQGVRLCRLPEDVRNRLNFRARFQGISANCGEIRFVTDAPSFVIRLMARKLSTWPQPMNPQMRVMCGNIEHSRVELPFNQMISIPFDAWSGLAVHPSALRPDPDFGFDPRVWRFVLPGCEIIFGGIELCGYSIRPPEQKEKPKYRLLCHGSSITNSYIEGWPSLMGHYLGIDVLNLGLAGACQAEHEIADYIAALDEYDAMVLELGINIMGMDPSEFERRVRYFMEQITGRHPLLPIALITVFPCDGDPLYWTEERRLQNAEKPDPFALFRSIIRKVGAEYLAAGCPILPVEGPEIDVPSKCWSVDLVHPRFVGNSFIAYKLGDRLRNAWPFLQEAGR